MGTNECSQPASKSSWDSQDFGDVNMVLKMLHFHKSSRPQWVKRSASATKHLVTGSTRKVKGILSDIRPLVLKTCLVVAFCGVYRMTLEYHNNGMHYIIKPYSL